MGFVPILASHGNAKESHPFHPTWPSTLERVKKECTTKGPKEVMEVISQEIGGVVGATAAGQLPRNEKQVANLKRKVTSKSVIANMVRPLQITFLLLCKELIHKIPITSSFMM